MPFRGLCEAWQASARPDNWRSVPVPTLLHLWWGLWLAAAIIDTASLHALFGATSVAELMAVEYLTALSCLLRVPLDLVFVRIVRQMTEMQTSALHRRTFT